MINGTLKDEKTEKTLIKIAKKLIDAKIAFNYESKYIGKLNKYSFTIYINSEYNTKEIANIIYKKYNIKMNADKFWLNKNITIKKDLYSII